MKKNIILLVEDDPIFRECLKEYFEADGFLVLEASNGVEADKQLAQVTPDYIMLDISMPEKDGFEVISSLKSSGIQIIAMSGSENNVAMAKSLGADIAILKPIDFTCLGDVIKSLTN